MSDTILTLAQLNAIFQALTMSMLGSAIIDCRISWPTGGAPSWLVNQDIAFLQVLETDSPYNRQRDVVMTNADTNDANQATSYTRVLAAKWIFYGPNSFSNAQSIRDLLFYQNNHDTLAQSNLFMVPDIVSPVRAPELFAGQWWERTDLIINFNETIVRNLIVPYIASAQLNIGDNAGSVIGVETVT